MIFAMMEVAQNTIRTPRRDFPVGPVVISARGTGSTPGQGRSHMLRDAAERKKKPQGGGSGHHPVDIDMLFKKTSQKEMLGGSLLDKKRKLSCQKE